MLVEALEHGEPGGIDETRYMQDPGAPESMIRRGELVHVGERYLDETDELDFEGEPIREPPPRWSSVPNNHHLKGIRT